MSKEINNKYGSQTKENPREFTKEFTFDGGQHAFQYSISIISITGKITTTNYRNGKEARKEFYKYKRKK